MSNDNPRRRSATRIGWTVILAALLLTIAGPPAVAGSVSRARTGSVGATAATAVAAAAHG